MRPARSPFVRAAAYVVAAAAVLAAGVGTVRSGSLGGGLALGLATAVGVAGGLLAFEAWNRSR